MKENATMNPEIKSGVEKITAYRKMIMMGVTTIRQAVTLLAVKYQPQITTTELAKVLGTNRSNAGASAAQLKEKGLIYFNVIKTNPYTRVYEITKKGADAIENALICAPVKGGSDE